MLVHYTNLMFNIKVLSIMANGNTVICMQKDGKKFHLISVMHQIQTLICLMMQN